MESRWIAALVIVALASIVFLARPAGAQTTELPRFACSLPATVVIDPRGATPVDLTNVSSVTDELARLLRRPIGTSIRFQSDDYAIGGQILVSWVPFGSSGLGDGAIGTTTPSLQGDRITGARVAIVPGLGVGLVRHELAHAFGATHSADPADVMYPYLVNAQADYTANDQAQLAAHAGCSRKGDL